MDNLYTKDFKKLVLSNLPDSSSTLLSNLDSFRSSLNKRIHLVSVINLVSNMVDYCKEFNLDSNNINTLSVEISSEPPIGLLFGLEPKILDSDEFRYLEDFINNHSINGLEFSYGYMSEDLVLKSTRYIELENVGNLEALECKLYDILLNKELRTILNKEMLQLSLNEINSVAPKKQKI